ncbi:TPR-like protein [Mycena capillaripes]|nr:TPR-like protein [Mycena capillaripes]
MSPSDMNKSILMHEDAVQLHPDGHPDKPAQLNKLGSLLLDRFQQLGDVGDINKSIMMFEDAIKLILDDHPDKTGLNFSDMNKSIMMLEDAIQLIPDSNSDKPLWLNSLGYSLLCRFQQLGNLIDINKSIMMHEDAIPLIPDDHPDKPLLLNNLSNSLTHRFQQLGNLNDLNQSILIQEDAVQFTPDGHPDKPARLNSLGSSLLHRFQKLGDLNDINKSIIMFEDAVQLTPDGQPHKLAWLNKLGNSLSRRFQQFGDVGDINKAIMIFEATIQLMPDDDPEKPGWLNNLGLSLSLRFERLGDLSDISKAIMMFEDAIQLIPDGHSSKPLWLNNLSTSLLIHLQQLGDLSYINRSITMLEDAIQLIPDGHANKPTLLNNLSNSLTRRFQQLGNLNDINKSILIKEDAVQLTPDGHPDKPAQLNNLGSSLLHRFQQLGDLSDINKSIIMFEDAVKLIPDGNPDRPLWLNNLGYSLLCRFQRLGDLSDINKSIMIVEDAIQLIPDGHPNKPSLLNSLGNSLLHRFQQLGDLSDINKSIMMFEDAIQLVPDGHPSKPLWLNNLGSSLSLRFQQLGDLSDINRSIMMLNDTAQLIPDGHPNKPGLWKNLGKSLLYRFQKLSDHGDLLKAISQLSLAAQSITGPVDVRFEASSTWALAARMCQHSSLLQAYARALELLPQLAWLGLSINDRHHHIMNAGKVVRDAAADAIAAFQYKQAVEWLEQGRSIIWGQLLQLRTPIDTLKQHYPKLADRFGFLSAQLEGVGTLLEVTNAGNQQSPQRVAQQFHAYAHERDELIKEIRELEGFENFLLPRTLSQLSSAAQGGPVVILNTSRARCDALILIPGLDDDEVMHVPLTNFTLNDAQDLHMSLRNLTGSRCNMSHHSDRLHGHREDDITSEEKFKHLLSELWQRVAHPVLDALAITTPSTTNLQRIWWCLTGPLAFLPIHAAGLYEDSQPSGSKLSDFVISSYTPSLTALISGYQARPASEPQRAFKLLTVAQPFTDGQSDLPGTLAEIDHIQYNAAGKHCLQQLQGNAATVDSVQQGMKECSWIHLACHGVQNVSNPTESALLLASGSQLTLSSIIRLSIPHADFAFLSACQTATGDKELEEESVHLAAGMLSAGYRSIIATMWSIMDNDAPRVASDVYEHLFKVSPPDSGQSAKALHLAIRKLRKESGSEKSFMHWVPYIHIGV